MDSSDSDGDDILSKWEKYDTAREEKLLQATEQIAGLEQEHSNAVIEHRASQKRLELVTGSRDDYEGRLKQATRESEETRKKLDGKRELLQRMKNRISERLQRREHVSGTVESKQPSDVPRQSNAQNERHERARGDNDEDEPVLQGADTVKSSGRQDETSNTSEHPCPAGKASSVAASSSSSKRITIICHDCRKVHKGRGFPKKNCSCGAFKFRQMDICDRALIREAASKRRSNTVKSSKAQASHAVDQQPS